MQRARLDFAQVADGLSTQDAERIGPRRVIRELRMEHGTSLSYMQMQIDEWAKHCSFFLLIVAADEVKKVSALQFNKPWILSVDKENANIREMLKNCRPDGVELADSVEIAPGIQDAGKILQVIHELDK